MPAHACILSPSLVTSGNRYPACSLPKFAFLSTLSTAAAGVHTDRTRESEEPLSAQGTLIGRLPCTPHLHCSVAAAQRTACLTLPVVGALQQETAADHHLGSYTNPISCTAPALPLLTACHPPAGNPGTSRGLLVQQSHRRRLSKFWWVGAVVGRRRLRLQHREQLEFLLKRIAAGRCFDLDLVGRTERSLFKCVR